MSDPREVMRKAMGLAPRPTGDEPQTWGEGTGVLTHYPRPCRCNRCPDCGGSLPWWQRYMPGWPFPVPQYTY